MLVLFDIDGTLLDDEAAVAAGVRALHASTGAILSLEQFASAWQAALDRYFDLFASGGIGFLEQRRARIRDVVDASLDDAAADALFDVYLHAHEQAWALYEDVLPCLETLESHRLGIVSNGLGSQQRAKLEQTGILGRFDPIVISDDVDLRKPDPAIFLRACSAAGVAPHDAVHVGDRYGADAVGARSAGLTGVWLDRAGARQDKHEAPVVSNLVEFARALGPA